MKRLIAVLLAIILTVGSFSGCAKENFRFDDDTSLSRGQWIELLAGTFGLDEYEQKKPYFKDIRKKNNIFTAVQSCYEWGVLKDVPKRFNQNKGASREFVITTVVYAIGNGWEKCEGSSDRDKAIQYALENNIIKEDKDYKKWATSEECQSILSVAQFVYLNQEIEPIDTVVMNENVSDQRETNNINQISENQYIVTGMNPSEGDVLIAPGTTMSPDGVAIKVASAVDNGDGTYTVTTVTPELHEVFDEVEFADVVVPEFEDIIPAAGVSIMSSDGTSIVSNGNDTVPKMKSLSTVAKGMPTNVTQLAMADSKENALSFTASCNFTKGTVSVSPSWSNASANIQQLMSGEGSASPEAGEWFSKTSVFPDKTLLGPDAYSNDKAIQDYKEGKINAEELKSALKAQQNDDGTEKIPNLTNKFSGGYEIVGELAIKDLYVVPTYKLKTAKVLGIDTGVPTGIENFSIETNYGVEASLAIKGKLEEELTVVSMPITLGGVGTLTLEIKLYAELNGEISVKASITNNTKTEYASGKTKKTSAQNATASAQAELAFETGPKLNAKISVLAIPIINADVSAALQIQASCSINLSSDWTETDEAFVIDRKTSFVYGVDGHVPIVKIGIGTDGSTLANKLSLTFSWTLVGAEGSNAPLKAAKFDIVPEKEIIIWEEHQELPKDKTDEENLEQLEQDSKDNLGGNMNISSYYIHLTVGEKSNVDLEYPGGYDADDFKWTTSDKSVVTVKNGKLTGKGVGSAMITAESKDGKYYASCAVYVGE